MWYIIRLAIILMIVTGISAGALSLVNLQTRPVIEEYKKQQQAAARAEVMEEGRVFVLRDSMSALPYYEVYSNEDTTGLIGYIFTAEGVGYASTLVTVTGVDTAFNIQGIKITSQQETPGLGAKCMEVRYGEDDPWFQRQYFKDWRLESGMKPLYAMTVAVDKDGGEIHSITGATITGRVISNSIKESAKELKAKLEEGE